MTLAAGTRLGPYEILSPLGSGGMGEVYKGRDTRLDRTVAIKVLPAQLASDLLFRERFDREARTISQLDHPHICALHDVGHENGIDFLVMQFLDGETLAARLTNGALPLDQAFRYAIDIVGALDRAHRAGIVHRDLKPGNIMLVPRGGASRSSVAVLLDFGLARTGVVGAGFSRPRASMLPTTPPLTAQGTILGTFQYMAPEQLEGQEADVRTDIFAFGSVLYEMVTGTKAFEGKSQASLIGAILKDDPPPVSQVQPIAPSALDHVVKTCLAKDPDDRWQSARDLLRKLQWTAETSAGELRMTAPRLPMWRHPVSVAVAAFALLLPLAFLIGTRAPTESTAIPPWIDRSGRDVGTMAEPGSYPSFDLSNDARRVVLSKVQGSEQNLWMVDVERGSMSRLTLDQAAHVDPRWSPDAREVIFGSTRDSARSPFRVSLSAPDPVPVFKFDGVRFALDDWSPDGQHLLYHDAGVPALSAVRLDGDRKPFVVTRSLSGTIDQARFSPDGRWIAYNINESGRYEVEVVPFPATGDKWRISTTGGVQPTWRGDGRELYFLGPDGTLMTTNVGPGATFQWSEARPLFKVELTPNSGLEQYAPAPEGERFLFAKPAEGAPQASTTIVVNWSALLRN